jgi:hypothetical protein
MEPEHITTRSYYTPNKTFIGFAKENIGEDKSLLVLKYLKDEIDDSKTDDEINEEFFGKAFINREKKEIDRGVYFNNTSLIALYSAVVDQLIKLGHESNELREIMRDIELNYILESFDYEISKN